MRTTSAPDAAERARIAAAPPASLLCLFDVDALAQALPAARAWRAGALAPVAVRGRALPDNALDAFGAAWLGAGLAPLLATLGAEPPRWTHPVLLADAVDAGGTTTVGVVFSRLPEPGLLDLADVGRAGRREGAPPAALPIDLDPAALPDLLAAQARAGAEAVLLVDVGGDAPRLAEALAETGRAVGWFGPVDRPVPAAVRGPVHLWCEPEDAAPPAMDRACLWLPVAFDGDDVAAATARVRHARKLGYAAVAPRFHRPVPNTAEWQAMAAAGRPCGLDDRDVVFAVGDFAPGRGAALVAGWTREDRFTAWAPAHRRTRSLRTVREVLAGYADEARRHPPLCHARDLLTEALAALGGAPLQTQATYPFFRFGEHDLLRWVDVAIDARLRSLEGVTEPLLRTVQHTALAGGKRIRPVLTLAIGASLGLPPATLLPVALAIEWLHTASLIQDDLPCMDDEAVRRRQPTAHRRHGEGLALLASDALVALAFEDVAALADDPRVGPARTAALTLRLARALGAGGLVGGQALDLALRGRPDADLDAVLAVHRAKTVPLFRLAASLPAVLADVPAERAAALEAALGDLGLAFQIVDDLLDGGETLGRPPGSDARQGRPTFATLLEAAAARRLAAQLLAPLADGPLSRLARFVLERTP